MAEIRKFINSDLQGKDLVVNFFQKKFERLKFEDNKVVLFRVLNTEKGFVS